MFMVFIYNGKNVILSDGKKIVTAPEDKDTTAWIQ